MPAAKLRWWQKALLAFVFVAVLGLLAFWFTTTATFWQQVGWRLVAAVQNRVNGEVSISKISGNLITGMVFSDVKISRPQGDLIKVKELEVSLSLLSFLKLQPVIRTLIFRQPEVFLRQDADGSWNYANLIKPLPPPPFSQIHLRDLQIQAGLVQVDGPRQHQVFQDLTARLNLTVQAPGRPRQAVLINQGSVGLTLPSYPRLQTNFALTYSAGELQLQKSDITLADIPVLYLQGKVVNLGGTPNLDLSFKVPELSGPQVHELWPQWPQVVSTQAALEIRGPLDNLQITGSGAQQNFHWQLAGSWQTSGSGVAEFKVIYNFQNLTEKLLAAFYPAVRLTDCFSPLTGTLTVTGHGLPWPPASLQGRLEMQPFSYGQAKIEAAALSFKLVPENRQNLVLKLQGNFGCLEAEADGQLLQLFNFKNKSAGEIKLSASGFNPALLLGAKAPPGSLNLQLTGDFQMPPPFNWSQARLAAKAQASGKLGDYAFQELFVTGTWEAGELQLNPARLQMTNLRAEAQGRLSLTNADLKLSLELLPPGPWPLVPPDIKGQFRTTGTLKGEWQSLAYQFDFQGKSLSWRQLALASLQGKTAGTASRETFHISSFDILAQNLATPVGRFGQIHAVGQTQGANLVFNLNTPKSQGPSGALAGSAAWEKGAARIILTNFRWGLANFQVAAVQPVTLSIAAGRLEISPLRLQYQKAFFSLSGKMTDNDVSLQAKLENLEIQDISKFMPQISGLKGVVNAQADVTGPARAPILKAQVKVDSGQVGKFLASFQSNWLYQNHLLTLNGLIQEKPDKATIAWQGTSPVDFSLLPWSWHLPASGLQLRVWSDNLNMSLLAKFIPGVAASEGPLNLQSQIAGSFLQPLLAGTLRYGPGSLTIRPSGAPLAIEPGEIRLQGDRLILPHLIFHSGDGTGDITGGASLANLKLQDVQLNLKATNLLVIQREGSRAVANGQVSLKGSWPDFRTDGRLTVNDAQFRLAFFRSPQHSDIVLLPRAPLPPPTGSSKLASADVAKNFLIHLVIDIPGGVWLRDNEVNGEIEGQIKVLRQLNGPTYLGGSVKAKAGVFTVNNKVFNVEKAVLVFPGEPHKPTVIDARAFRQVEEYTLYASASGPLDNPRTRLESTPPLPPRDLLSLFVFDHLANKMTREEYVSVTQKAMGILGSLTAQKFKSLFGGELPLLGEVSPTGSQAGLGVGKRLSKDITVSYEHKLNPLPGEDLNQIRLDYKFNKYFSAESQIGRKNPGGDIFFNIDF